MNRRRIILAYLFTDWLSAAMSWTLLFVYRNVMFEEGTWSDWQICFEDDRFSLGLAIIPVFWLGVHAIAGMYLKPLKRHRILEVGQVTWTTLVGVLVLFFALLLDDAIVSYKQYYASLSVFLLFYSMMPLFPTSSTMHL